MKLSFVIPIYNVERYLPRCLDSLIKQTYQDIEIICVDDGSTDTCPQILSSYSKQDSRLKVITQENKGTLLARKVGIGSVSGDYILCVDPDDWVDLDTAKTVAEAIHQTAADIIQFGVALEEKKNLPYKKARDINKAFNCQIKHIDGNKNILKEVYINHNIPFNQCGKAIRADIVRQAFETIPNIRCIFAEDQCSGFFLFCHTNTFHIIPQKLYHYRIGIGISTKKALTINDYIKTLDSFDMLEAIKSFVDKHYYESLLHRQIVQDIHHSMLETAINLGSNRVIGITDDSEWIMPLCEKCGFDYSALSFVSDLKQKDILIKTLKKQHNKSEFSDTSEASRHHTKIKTSTANSSIVIGILARDCAGALKSNIPAVEELGKYFKDYHIIIYENDSHDDTKSIITDWQRNNHKVLAIMEDTEAGVQTPSIKVPYPEKSIYRIQRMARCRNRILEETKKKLSPDLFCFIDIDITKFYPINIIHAIEKAPNDWGGLFSNGSIYMKYSDHVVQDFLQYDSYAFVDWGVDPRKSKKWILDKEYHYITACRMSWELKKQEYLPCVSAFNGIGIYKWELIKELEYTTWQTPELERVQACFCEHIPFNMKIIEQGFKNYIARDMKVIYWYGYPRERKGLGKWKNHHRVTHFFMHRIRLGLRVLLHIFKAKHGMFPYVPIT